MNKQLTRFWTTLVVVLVSACTDPVNVDNETDETDLDTDSLLNDTDSGDAGIETDTQTYACDIVTFPDPAFEAYMREKLEIPTGPIRGTDVTSVGSILLNDTTTIHDIGGIECFQNLSMLSVWDNPLESIDLLRDMSNLNSIQLRNTLVFDLSPLSSYVGLRYLEIRDSLVTSVQTLAGLEFGILELRNNHIDDFTPLSKCKISTLNITGSSVTVLPSLALMFLDGLYASDNFISDLTPVTYAAKQLQVMNLSNNQISDLTPLAAPSFGGVLQLNLNDNLISDLSPLLDAQWLSDARIYLENNPISYESASVILPMLCELALQITWGEIDGADGAGCGEPPPPGK